MGPWTYEEDRRSPVQRAQRAAQIPRRQAFRGLSNLEDILAVQIEAIEIRVAPVRIAVVAQIVIDGNFQQALPETFPTKYPAP